MSIQLRFRGVMLFVTEGGLVRSLIVPETTQGPSNGGREHRDGTRAVRHYRGAALFDGTSLVARAPLASGSFSCGGDDYVKASHIRALPFIGEPRGSDNALELNLPGDESRIDLGFTEHPSSTSAVKVGRGDFAYYRFGGAFAQHLNCQFAGTVRIGAGLGLPEARDGQTIYIYNTDRQDPDYAYLERSAWPPNTPMIVDDDFKWLYSLLKPKRGTWQNWSNNLPAPTWWDDGSKTSSVSTCFPGWI